MIHKDQADAMRQYVKIIDDEGGELTDDELVVIAVKSSILYLLEPSTANKGLLYIAASNVMRRYDAQNAADQRNVEIPVEYNNDNTDDLL